MDATRTCRGTTSRAHRANRLIFHVLCLIAVVFPVIPAWAGPAQGSATLDGAWVVITVLAVLVAGLWLQSMRRRQL